jgi:hypothetical protein
MSVDELLDAFCARVESREDSIEIAKIVKSLMRNRGDARNMRKAS